MKLNKKLFTASLSAALLAAPILVSAVVCPVPPPITPANAGNWFQCIIINLLNIVIWPIFIAVAIIMFIWAGILFLSAHGDPAKVGEARKALIWGVIGVVVGLLGYTIVGVIRGALGL